MKTKQIIVVNRALNMPAGKLAAQVAHASMGALFKCATTEQFDSFSTPYLKFNLNGAVGNWINGLFTKVVVYVKSEEKLLKIRDLAQAKQLPHALITDSGLTFFDKPTITCLGIGPCWEDDFIGVTDKLQLLE